jgi:hypothetical protein
MPTELSGLLKSNTVGTLLVCYVSAYNCAQQKALLGPSVVILLYLLISGLTNETPAGDMKRVKHFFTICLLGLLLLEVSHKRK